MKTLRSIAWSEFGERAAVLGRNVLIAESPIHDSRSALEPDEMQFVAGASDARAREYSTGRILARELLIELGAEAPIVTTSADRSPVWPAGFLGSIAHTSRCCIVAVARVDDVGSVGVDVEPAQPLERDVFEAIATRRELGAMSWASAHERGLDARRLFVAKEAVYKCLYPVNRQFLEFADVEITFDAERKRFRARCERAGAIVRRLEGFVTSRLDDILAVALIPTRARVEVR